MALRPLHSAPYSTYAEFERVFDRAHFALNGGLSPQQAREMGFFVPMTQEYVPAKPDPRFAPHGLTLEEMYRFGIQHGLTYDPLHWGMPFGRPVQGYGNNLTGRPMYPHPDWPLKVPFLKPPLKNSDEEEAHYRPRYKPF